MVTKSFKASVAFLEAHGFEYDRTNSKGRSFYTREGCAEVGISTGIQDHEVKKLMVVVQRAVGERTAKDLSKRDAVAVKERRAGDRARAAAEASRVDAIRADLVAQRERHLDGIGAVLSDREVAAIVRQIEDADAELAYWRALMTSVPGNRADAGRPRARHRS